MIVHPYFLYRIGKAPAPPQNNNGGWRSIVGFWVGGFAGYGNIAPAPPSKPKAGWAGRYRRISREEYEELRRQEHPDWYERFLAAKYAVEERAEKAKPAQRKVLAQAIAAAEEIEPELIEPVTLALEAAASASRVTASINHAKHVLEIIRELEFADEDEAIVLLLN